MKYAPYPGRSLLRRFALGYVSSALQAKVVPLTADFSHRMPELDPRQ